MAYAMRNPNASMPFIRAWRKGRRRLHGEVEVDGMPQRGPQESDPGDEAQESKP